MKRETKAKFPGKTKDPTGGLFKSLFLIMCTTRHHISSSDRYIKQRFCFQVCCFVRNLTLFGVLGPWRIGPIPSYFRLKMHQLWCYVVIRRCEIVRYMIHKSYSLSISYFWDFISVKNSKCLLGQLGAFSAMLFRGRSITDIIEVLLL